MSNLTIKMESFGPKWSWYALKYQDFTRTLIGRSVSGKSYKVKMPLEMTNQIKKDQYTS